MRWQDAQAGHFVPGRGGAVLLEERLIRVQCVQCNVWLRGNYHVFTLRMIDEVGREEVEAMLRLKHERKKWTRTDLAVFIVSYSALLRDLRSCDAVLGGALTGGDDSTSTAATTPPPSNGSSGSVPF